MSKQRSKVKVTKMWATPWTDGSPVVVWNGRMGKNCIAVYVLDARDYKAMKAELKRLAEVEVGYVASIHGISRHAARAVLSSTKRGAKR